MKYNYKLHRTIIHAHTRIRNMLKRKMHIVCIKEEEEEDNGGEEGRKDGEEALELS